MRLEYEDIEPFLFRIKQDLKRELIEEFSKNVFLRYPKQLAEHLSVSERTARRLWNEPDFPRSLYWGIKGVYLNELKDWRAEI